MKKLVSLFIAIVMMSCVVLTVPVSAGYIGNCPYPSCQKPADLCVCEGCYCRNPNNLASQKITNEQLAEMIADGAICIDNSDVALYRYLSLSDNLISYISPLAELTNLGNLSLNKNQIADISPLASLTGLEWLGLSDNVITDISSLAGLTNLRGLWLSNNLIDDISPLNQLQKLNSLNVQGNPGITLKQVEELSESLPNCEIHSDFGIYSKIPEEKTTPVVTTTPTITTTTPFEDITTIPTTTTATITTTKPVTTITPAITIPPLTDNTCKTCKICKSGKPPVKGCILGESEPNIFDFMEILKYIVEVDNALDKCDNALNAALMTDKSQETGTPTIFDGIEVLKIVVGI